MSKGIRLSEKWFRRGLWMLSFVFASFLMGLGSLVVNDLPKVESRLDRDDFLDRQKSDPIAQKIKNLDSEINEVREQIEKASIKTARAHSDYQQQHEVFRNWIQTRNSTQKSSQDPEVIKRSQQLELLKQEEMKYQHQVDNLSNRLAELDKSRNKENQGLIKLNDEALTKLYAKTRKQELRIFVYRLILTLPLIALAGWLFARKRKGSYWPFVWGFIYFALYAFFVELVPYLPSYGGYIRYIVGIIVTFVVGQFTIKSMQAYLEKQKLQEAQPDNRRRQELSYDLVLARLGKKVCPGCERPIDVTSLTANHCPHCGIGVFNQCAKCNTRKNAFSPYCFCCGAPDIEANKP